MIRIRSISPEKYLSQFSKGKTRRRFFLWATRALVLLCVLMVLGFFGMLGVLGWVSRSLPSPDRLINRQMELSTKIFDRNGKLLYDVYGEKNRTLVKISDVSPYLVKATLATEDAEFYIHKGFDLPGMARAVLNIARGEGLQGGSTITQQLTKNALLSTERTVPRKVKEFILALQIERKYTKDEILQMYLNEAPYGGQSWGVETASLMYFGKEAKDLDLAESALLAGLPQKPSSYSPFGPTPENAKRRQTYVLYLMQHKGWIDKSGKRQFLSEKEATAAKEEPLKYTMFGTEIKAPHFVMYVKQLLAERYGDDLVEQGGLQVTTTLDLKKQEVAQQAVTEEVKNSTYLKVGNGALVAMDPKTGQILAMVGSKDYFAKDYDGKYNVALALRQPGSSIKPVTYVTAFKQGYTPSTMIIDAKTTWPSDGFSPPYTPVNYDGKFRGPLSFRTALANSINVAAVKVLDLVGIDAMIQTAHEMGITSLNDRPNYGLALTLGGGEVKPLDMAVVFSTFASGGIKHDPIAILRVTDAHGKVLEQWRETPGRRILKEGQAYLVSHILSDNFARAETFGLQTPLRVGDYQAAVKTGTTDDKKDNWCIGYTPSIVVATWVGNNDGTPMSPTLSSGITGAAPIWNRVMGYYLKELPTEFFERPSDVIEMTVDKISGELPIAGQETKNEVFVKGTEPKNESSVHKLLKVCQPDGKLATEACIHANKYDEKWYVVLKDLKPTWQSFTDEWLRSQPGDISKYFAPTEKSRLYFNESGGFSENGVPLVELNVRDDQTLPSDFKVQAEAFGPFPITKLKFYLDDILLGEVTGENSGKASGEVQYRLDSSLKGKHTIRVFATDSMDRTGDKSVGVKVD